MTMASDLRDKHDHDWADYIMHECRVAGGAEPCDVCEQCGYGVCEDCGEFVVNVGPAFPEFPA